MNITEINGCVIVPTYNNEKTLARVLDGVLELVPADRLIVINDGATDSTPKILEKFAESIHILVNDSNQGKGFALRKGIKKAIELGFDNAITIDSDGQHFASDIPNFIAEIQNEPNSLLIEPESVSFGVCSFGVKILK